MVDDSKKVSLVFSFYLTEDFETNIANKMHFLCLEKYNKYFSDSTFVILTKDVNNMSLIKKLEQKIIDCGFVNNIRFIIHENHIYREAFVFKTYVIDKLHDFKDNLVCFAHNKGVSNVCVKDKDKESILNWIFIMYFGIFNYFDEALHKMIDADDRCLFFGSCLSNYNIADDGNVKGFAPMYNGTIYLLNPGEILFYARTNDLQIHPIGNRWYAENFAKYFLKFDDFSIMYKAGSHFGRSFSYYDINKIYFGKDGGWTSYFEYLFSEDLDIFNKQLDDMKNKVKNG